MHFHSIKLLLILLFSTLSFISRAGEVGRDSLSVTPNTSTNSLMPVQGTIDKTKASAEEILDVLPAFAGGEEGFFGYISSTMEYPYAARYYNVQGRVLVRFAVCKNGSLDDIRVLSGLGYGCDEEVVRVIKASPKWKPGLRNGEPVDVYYTLPVTFQLGR